MKQYKLIKSDSNDLKAEFDQYTFWAESKDDAWELVFGLCGRYGKPEENQYTLEEVKK